MKTLSLLSFIVASLEAFSQPLVGTIRGLGADGSVTPIAGARLQWKGTQHGALTRSDGSFAIERPLDNREADTLIVHAVGYRSDTIAVSRALHHLNHTLNSEFVARPVHVEGEVTTIATAEPIRTELVTRRQLEQSACCTLAESFERSSSAEVQYSDAVLGAKTIRLLGLRGIYTTGLTEAIPLLRGVTNAYALDDVPGPFLDRISISKGAASVLNGYDGITGQINVEFKKPNRDVPFFANAFANQLGRAELNITSAQQLSSDLYTMVMLHGRIFQRDIDANRDGFMDMPRFRNINAIARMLWQGDNREIQVVVRPTWGNYRSGSMNIWGNGMSGYRIETTTERFEGYAKIAFNELESPLASNIGLQLAFSKQRLETYAGTRTISADETFVLGKLIAVVEPIDVFRVIYGISMLYDTPKEKLDSLRFQRIESVPGIFAEATWSPSPEFTATLGIRHDWHNLFGAHLTPRMHVKYAPTELTTLRMSAGTGLRIPFMVADNAAAFLNNRQVILDSTVLPERAFNVGGGITAIVPIGDRSLTIDGEFYHTRFWRQVVTDFDRSARQVAIVYTGHSYANSALIQLATTIVPRLDVTIAYRLIDTYAMTGGALRLQPLLSPHRVLISASYQTQDNVWEFNPLIVWYSSGRIPTTGDNPPQYQLPKRFPDYVRASLQINYRPQASPWEFYIGVENLTNVLQPLAVLAADNPSSAYFDASLVWGPLDQRTFYVGIRLRFDRSLSD